ncbi:PAS domain-containing sensor histidine kinase [Frigidibacter sp. MR17.24]|uniref:PAS domain-containing sensor histidine kinase n=1 Tax=Frigidibacter sp. MR17.24 TaxID=3127345 RepID=UPI003012B315
MEGFVNFAGRLAQQTEALTIFGCFLLSVSLLLVLLRTKRLTAEMQRQAERFRAAVDEHCMVNVSDANGRIKSINAKFLGTSGFRRDEVIGARIAQLEPVGVTPERTAEVEAKMRAGQIWSGETCWNRRDGSQYYTHSTVVPVMDERGKLVETFAIRTDITNQKAADSESQLRATLDLWQDEVWMFDPVDMTFSYMNRRALARLGWRDDAYAGRSVAETGAIVDIAQLQREMRRMLTGMIRTTTFEIDDADRTVEVTLQLVKPPGNAARFVTILRDVTERQAAMRAKAEFTAMVSHELRTPLTSIKGGLSLLQMTASADMTERARGILGIAQRNTDRLILLINDILDLEKIDAGKLDMRLVETDLSALIREAVEVNASYGTQFGVRFRGVNVDAPAIVEASPERLMQVLANLMSNAAKFSHSGDEVEVGIEDRGNALRIFVRDRGDGIPLEAQPKILERFTQAESGDRRRHGGTGLGLAIVKAIIEQHGSEIRFDSVPGEGTEFYFELQKHAQRNVA